MFPENLIDEEKESRGNRHQDNNHYRGLHNFLAGRPGNLFNFLFYLSEKLNRTNFCHRSYPSEKLQQSQPHPRR